MTTTKITFLTSAAACFALPAFSQVVETNGGYLTDGPGLVSEKLHGAEGDVQKISDDSEHRQKSASLPDTDDKRRRRGALEEIIVTAQKREQLLREVPISMSVLGGDELDQFTGPGVVEALSRVPGVAVDTIFLSGGTQMTVRGAAPSGFAIAGGSPVAYYLDSIPFALIKTTIAPDAAAYDLERVEVLRGPQGTLYGASALNGVVRVLTREANLDAFELKARGMTSNTKDGEWNYGGDMAINLPIVEGKVAVRAVIGYQDIGGWIDKQNDRDANDSELGNLRLKVNAQPTDELSIGASVWLSRSDYGAPPISAEPEMSRSTIGEPISTDYDAYGLKIAYDASAVSLMSLTSYIKYVNDSVLDLNPGGAAPFSLQTVFDGKVFSEEVNIRSKGTGAWRWSAGGMYRDVEDGRRQALSIIEGPADVLDTSESVAVFGELTRLFLDKKLELTAGLRYFEDRVTGADYFDFGRVPGPGMYGRDTFESVSPRLILNWHESDRLTLYASYAEGFRSGYLQNPAVLTVAPGFGSADPDTLKNYEIGAKGALLGDRINFDSAVYYMDWQDVQQQLGVFYPPCSCNIVAVLNGESASGVGVDFSLTTTPVGGLAMGVNMSWNDLTFDAPVFDGGTLLYDKGDRLNFSPEWTAGASVDYVLPMGLTGLEGTFSASANYTSERGSVGIVAGVRDDTHSDAVLIGRASFSVGSKYGWTATLFVDNVTNEQGSPTRTAAAPNWTVRIRPRTVGMQVEYRY